jgi:diadenosine tetraphosphate (Ap4A) HIT family hydrolase
VVLADEPDYPGFLRVVLNAHVREMTDLPAADQQALMQVVFGAEAALRDVLAPDKINLASLGNVVPHLHWHVIPRFGDDPHFLTLHHALGR